MDEIREITPEDSEDRRYAAFRRPSPLMVGGGTMLAAGIVDLLAHLGPTGLVIGGIAAFIASQHVPDAVEQVSGALPVALPRRSNAVHTADGKRTLLDRALGRHPVVVSSEIQEPDDTTLVEEEDEEDEYQLHLGEEAIFASSALLRAGPSIKRITVEQAVAHIERNSYEAYLGRSLTRPGNPAVKFNFYKRHLKLIGASQHGKSSMAAALLDMITRTHDPRHVQIALLDIENKTGNLFAHLPHVARVRKHGETIQLHATNYDQVLEHLTHLVSLIEYRYTLSEEELDRQPVVIVYLEEFIDLKDHFKLRIDAVERSEKDQAKQEYAQLVYCIKQIARRGLKVYVQLLMCAQVDYRDDDLQEALVNVTSGLSFCVRVSAAQAAGFYQTELITRNARENKLGQAVVEMPDCKDLILAPEYDLRARLKALAQAQKRPQAAAQPVVELALMEADEEDEALRERPLAPEAAKITLLPARAEQKPQPKLKDAIACWNELVEAGQNPSRNNLQQALIAKGFECRENWARKFYEDIRDMLPKADTTSVGG